MKELVSNHVQVVTMNMDIHIMNVCYVTLLVYTVKELMILTVLVVQLVLAYTITHVLLPVQLDTSLEMVIVANTVTNVTLLV
jgi:hypothetical protein